jgi:hypothetical protein
MAHWRHHGDTLAHTRSQLIRPAFLIPGLLRRRVCIPLICQFGGMPVQPANARACRLPVTQQQVWPD